MIIKSSQRAGHSELAAHLVKSRDIDGTPQTVTISGSRQLPVTDNVRDALRVMEMISKASQRVQKDLYHVSISPEKMMTDEDWAATWEAYETEFGLSHLPYIEVTHDKKGGNRRPPHRHRAYERVDVDTGLAVHLNHTRIRNEKVARVVEFSLNHPLTIGKHNRTVIRQLEEEGAQDIIVWMQQGHAHDCDRPVANQNHQDVQQQQRTQVPTAQVVEDLQACYQQSLNGLAFEAALAKKRYVLAKGTRRDYVIVDWAGGVHSPRRRIGVKAKPLREKLQDLNREDLPTVAEVMQVLQELNPRVGKESASPAIFSTAGHKGEEASTRASETNDDNNAIESDQEADRAA